MVGWEAKPKPVESSCAWPLNSVPPNTGSVNENTGRIPGPTTPCSGQGHSHCRVYESHSMHERNVNPQKHCPYKVRERSSLFPCIPRYQPHPFLNPACVQCLSLNKHLLGSRSKCYEHKTMRKEGRRVMTLQAITSGHRTETTCPHVIPSYTCFPLQLSRFPKSPRRNGKAVYKFQSQL